MPPNLYVSKFCFSAMPAQLLISTDLEEIFSLSDRILVMFEGEIMGEVPADYSLIEQVGLMMAGKRLDQIQT